MGIVQPAAGAAEPPDDRLHHTDPSTIAADFRALADLFDSITFEVAPMSITIGVQVVQDDGVPVEVRRRVIESLSLLMSGRPAEFWENIGHLSGGIADGFGRRTKAHAFGAVAPGLDEIAAAEGAALAQAAARVEAERREQLLRAVRFADVDPVVDPVVEDVPAPAAPAAQAFPVGTINDFADEPTVELPPAYVPRPHPTGDAANYATVAQLRAAGDVDAPAGRCDDAPVPAAAFADVEGIEVTRQERELLEALYRGGPSDLATHNPDVILGLRRAGLISGFGFVDGLLSPASSYRLTEPGERLAERLFFNDPAPYQPVDEPPIDVGDLDAGLRALVASACPECARPLPAPVDALIGGCPWCGPGGGRS